MTTQPETDDLRPVIKAVSSLNYQTFDDILYFCDKSWPRCKPSLDRMILVRDRVQMAMAEINLCL